MDEGGEAGPGRMKSRAEDHCALEVSWRRMGGGTETMLCLLSTSFHQPFRDVARLLRILILLSAYVEWGFTTGSERSDRCMASVLHHKMCAKIEHRRLHGHGRQRLLYGDWMITAAPMLSLRGGSDNPEHANTEESEGRGTSEMQGTSSLQNVEEITMDELKALPLPGESRKEKAVKKPGKPTDEKRGDQSVTESKDAVPMEFTEMSVEKGVKDGSTGSVMDESKTGSDLTGSSTAHAIRKYRHPTRNAVRDMIREKLCDALQSHALPGDKYSALDAAIAIEHSMYQ